MHPWLWPLLTAYLVVGLVCSCVLGDPTPLLISALAIWSCWRLTRWLN
jgi:hypothetical protein